MTRGRSSKELDLPGRRQSYDQLQVSLVNAPLDWHMIDALGLGIVVVDIGHLPRLRSTIMTLLDAGYGEGFSIHEKSLDDNRDG